MSEQSSNNPSDKSLSAWPLFLGGIVLIPVLIAVSYVMIDRRGFDPAWEAASGSFVSPKKDDRQPEITTVKSSAGPETVIASHPESVPAKEEATVDSDDGSLMDTAPEDEARSASTLEKRTADWRYLRSVRGGGKAIAVVQRMRTPNSKLHALEGSLVGGILVQAVEKEALTLAYKGETRTLPISKGPAFDIDNVVIPMELADDPMALAQAVFAQTLGQYMAEPPSVEDVDEDSYDGGDQDAMDLLAETNNWIPSLPGESSVEWFERIADQGVAIIPDEVDNSVLSDPGLDIQKIIGISQ